MSGRYPSLLYVLALLLQCVANPSSSKHNIVREQKLTPSQLAPSGQKELHRVPGEPVEVSLDTKNVVFEVDPEFLSVTLDSGHVSNNWSGINFTAPRIINMAKGLNPAMLRVGGTSADFLLFNKTTGKSVSRVEDSNFTMTTAQWDAVNVFVKAVGWEFIFGLNSLLRNPYPVGVWDSTNGAELMSYSTSKGYTVNWELGNEPDLWFLHYGWIIPAKDHAKDFTILKDVIEKEKPLGKLIVGPDVAINPLYFSTFLENVGKGILNATSYHHNISGSYYASGPTGALPEFYSIELLDTFISDAQLFRDIVDEKMPEVDLWLGETSSMFSGGTPHLSDSYVAGFM